MPKVVLKLGDDISTDDIYPGRYMATVLPSETPQFCFADRLDFNAKLKSKVIEAGSVIVAGENFGCGSSREQAVSTIKGHELIIVAKSIARIFLQNAINLGLDLVICPNIEADEGNELEFEPDKVMNRTRNLEFSIQSLPPARQAIIDAGGLIPYTRWRLLESETSGEENTGPSVGGHWFEDLRVLEWEGKRWAVLDKQKEGDRTYLGLAAFEDLERFVQGMNTGAPSAFPQVLCWTEETSMGLVALSSEQVRKLQTSKGDRAVTAFQRHQNP